MSLFDDIPEDYSSDTYPDVDPPSCQLLGPTALVVQALMGLFVILSLVYKRHRETPKRPWKIWLFDVSKQIVGQLFLHGTNLLVSGLVSHHTDGNACVSYFLNILIDTTFGILMIYVTLHSLTHIFTEKLHLKGFESGIYGNPPSFNYWCRQAALYILSLTAMKVVVVAILAFVPAIYDAGEWLLSWTTTGDGDAVQVVFVMGIFPIIMNVVQFWIIDSIVKASSGVAPFLDIERGDYRDQEPLFRATSEDEDDQGPPERSTLAADRASISSSGSRELDRQYSSEFATDVVNSNKDEHKSSASSSRQVSDAHSYPPSLSSSFSSDSTSSHASKGPREAKNLQKKKRTVSPTSLTPSKSTFPPSSPRSRSPKVVSSSPSSQIATFAVAEDNAWADSWDDPAEWEGTHDKQHGSSQLIPPATHSIS